MPISDATRADAVQLVQRYPVARSALLPLLHLVMSDEGYVSEDGIAFCAELLGLTKAEVGAVSTFYTMYKREPFGDYLLSVCTNPTCAIAGGQRIYDSYVERCGGPIDRDGSGVMVEHAECLAICDAAPVVQVNYEMYGPLGHDQAMELLDQAKAGEPPASRSGEVPPDIRSVHRELAGMEDAFGDHLVEASRLQASSDNPPAYRTGETELPVSHPGADPMGPGGAAFREVSGIGGGPSDRFGSIERAVVEEVAEGGRGVDQQLAAQATVDQPAGQAPATEEQPTTAGRATPPEAEPADEAADEGADGAEEA